MMVFEDAGDALSEEAKAEIDALTSSIVQMGGLAEAELEAALSNLSRHDPALVQRCKALEARIDVRERVLTVEATRILGLHRPTERPLRDVIAAIKAATDLERIGDYASSIARRATALVDVPEFGPIQGIGNLGRRVRQALEQVLDAYGRRDVDVAIGIWDADHEIDDLYTSLVHAVMAAMAADTALVIPSSHLLVVAKALERIGDHATNIAELVYFRDVGQPLARPRPKRDDAGFTLPVEAGAVLGVLPE